MHLVHWLGSVQLTFYCWQSADKVWIGSAAELFPGKVGKCLLNLKALKNQLISETKSSYLPPFDRGIWSTN